MCGYSNPGDFSFHITISQQTSPKHKLQRLNKLELNATKYIKHP